MVIIGFLSYLTPLLAVFVMALIHGQRVAPQVILGMIRIIPPSIWGKLVLNRRGKA